MGIFGAALNLDEGGAVVARSWSLPGIHHLMGGPSVVNPAHDLFSIVNRIRNRAHIESLIGFVWFQSQILKAFFFFIE